jgi:membrane-bound lytic murein transglycosylase MltF
MLRSRFAALGSALVCAIFSVLFLASGCKHKENSTPAAEAAKPATAETTARAAEASLVPPEAAANEDKTLALPMSFPRRTGDLDEMLKARNLRALVLINPINFFYQNGQPRGITYEALEEFERFVNKKYKTGALKVKVTFIPMSPDEMAEALNEGVGDFIAQGIVITPAREERYAFTIPIQSDIKDIVVTGGELGNVTSFDELVGKDIYANPLTERYAELQAMNAQRVKDRKPPLTIKAADKNLLEDDLIQMVNAGLIPATVSSQPRAELWAQVLPKVKPHPELVFASGQQVGWVMRKNNPELKKLLDEFAETHKAGTSFGNTLLRRYLQNTKWIKNSTSTEEMKKFQAYVEYFKKYSGEYNFDYLMIAAQGYQESLLDQNRRSPVGAVGIMQVIPKYAAANPINVRNVNQADQNILAGVRMLRNIADTYFNDPAVDQVNRTLFTFASYNAGPNRIVRLRKKAADDGLNPNKWFGNVELEVAEDVGQETVTYVSNIYKYYVAYKLTQEQAQEKKKAMEARS